MHSWNNGLEYRSIYWDTARPINVTGLLASNARSAVRAVRSQVVSAPAATQCLDQQDAGIHTSCKHFYGGALIGYSDSLGRRDFQVRSYTAAIAVERQIKGPICRGHSFLLADRFFLQDSQRRKVVLDLTK